MGWSHSTLLGVWGSWSCPSAPARSKRQQMCVVVIILSSLFADIQGLTNLNHVEHEPPQHQSKEPNNLFHFSAGADSCSLPSQSQGVFPWSRVTAALPFDIDLLTIGDMTPSHKWGVFPNRPIWSSSCGHSRHFQPCPNMTIPTHEHDGKTFGSAMSCLEVLHPDVAGKSAEAWSHERSAVFHSQAESKSLSFFFFNGELGWTWSLGGSWCLYSLINVV